MSMLKELFGFVMARKKWWLLPVILILAMLGVIMVVSEVSVLAPVIYTLF